MCGDCISGVERRIRKLRPVNHIGFRADLPLKFILTIKGLKPCAQGGAW